MDLQEAHDQKYLKVNTIIMIICFVFVCVVCFIVLLPNLTFFHLKGVFFHHMYMTVQHVLSQSTQTQDLLVILTNDSITHHI